MNKGNNVFKLTRDLIYETVYYPKKHKEKDKDWLMIKSDYVMYIINYIFALCFLPICLLCDIVELIKILRVYIRYRLCGFDFGDNAN